HGVPSGIRTPTQRTLSLASPMTPSTPSTTLFPYTTLFRSVSQHLDFLTAREFHRLSQGTQSLCHIMISRVSKKHLHNMKSKLPQDRKSTRLNSSHVSISYALFCLKKKSNTIHIRTCAQQIE